MSKQTGLVDLVTDVAQASADLVSAELARARAEIDERTQHATQLAVNASITITLVALSLQAFGVAAIIGCAEVLGSYLYAALLVGGLFFVLALLFGLAVRRSARLTAHPLRLEGPDRPALPESAEETT